MQIYKAL